MNQLLSRDNTFRSSIVLTLSPMYSYCVRITTRTHTHTRTYTRVIHAYIGTSIDEKTIRPRGHVLSMPLNGIVGQVFRDSRPFSSTRRLDYYYSPLLVPISKSLLFEREKKLRFNNGLILSFRRNFSNGDTFARPRNFKPDVISPSLLCLFSPRMRENSFTNRSGIREFSTAGT